MKVKSGLILVLISGRLMKIDKPGLAKKSKPTKDKAHLNWVASQGCMIPGCLESPCIHHIRILGEERDDRRTIPLCYRHHQGECGLHTKGKKEWRKMYGHELDMLETLMERKCKSK